MEFEHKAAAPDGLPAGTVAVKTTWIQTVATAVLFTVFCAGSVVAGSDVSWESQSTYQQCLILVHVGSV